MTTTTRELPTATYRAHGDKPARPSLSCPYKAPGARTHAVYISGVFELDRAEAWLFDCRTCDRWIDASPSATSLRSVAPTFPPVCDAILRTRSHAKSSSQSGLTVVSSAAAMVQRSPLRRGFAEPAGGSATIDAAEFIPPPERRP